MGHEMNRAYFAHGMESGPWGRKITALAAVAEAQGFAVESVDFTTTRDPEARVHILLDRRPAADGRLVFVGSSMGGYVVARAAERCPVAGLFLLAPAFHMPGYSADPAPVASEHEVVHGWDDDIVPVDNAIEYARRHHARLHVLDSGHDLNDRILTLEGLFAAHLQRVVAAHPGESA